MPRPVRKPYRWSAWMARFPSPFWSRCASTLQSPRHASFTSAKPNRSTGKGDPEPIKTQDAPGAPLGLIFFAEQLLEIFRPTSSTTYLTYFLFCLKNKPNSGASEWWEGIPNPRILGSPGFLLVFSDLPSPACLFCTRLVVLNRTNFRPLQKEWS